MGSLNTSNLIIKSIVIVPYSHSASFINYSIPYKVYIKCLLR